jgi:FkbM family methyltransferase
MFPPEITNKLGELFKTAVAKYRGFRVTPDITIPVERFGSGYGGWDVVTAGIDSRAIVYSFGVGEDATFDTALIEKFQLTVHAFDPTPKSLAWVKRQRLPDRFIVHGYGLAAFDGDVSFNPPANAAHVSHTLLERPATKARAISVPVRRLGTIMKELGHDHIDLLKMDIEGAEYEVIADIGASGIRPGQILVEFHHRFPGAGVKRSQEAIERLRAMGYQLFSASVTREEFGFIRISS